MKIVSGISSNQKCRRSFISHKQTREKRTKEKCTISFYLQQQSRWTGLSKTLNEYPQRYSVIERECLLYVRAMVVSFEWISNKYTNTDAVWVAMRCVDGTWHEWVAWRNSVFSRVSNRNKRQAIRENKERNDYIYKNRNYKRKTLVLKLKKIKLNILNK